MQIKNKAVNFVFNKFDFPIRFFYSRLGLHKMFFWKIYSSDFTNVDFRFEGAKQFLNKEGYTLKDKVCLELGPGNSYINAYNFLMNGAKKVILVDKYPRYFESKKQRDFFEKEKSFIRKKYGTRNVRGEDIEFFGGDLREFDLQEKVDFICSISVLEHIKDIEDIIKEFARIIKKGGVMYHRIDMRDHYNFSNPFLFLKYSKSIWDKYLTKEGVSYTNRMRYPEFKDLFEKYGFKILKEEKEKLPVKKVKIHKEFAKERKDFDVAVWSVLLLKT